MLFFFITRILTQHQQQALLQSAAHTHQLCCPACVWWWCWWRRPTLQPNYASNSSRRRTSSSSRLSTGFFLPSCQQQQSVGKVMLHLSKDRIIPFPSRSVPSSMVYTTILSCGKTVSRNRAEFVADFSRSSRFHGRRKLSAISGRFLADFLFRNSHPERASDRHFFAFSFPS